MCTTGKAQITHDILAYLVEYPNSQDTLEGIVEWWLLKQEIERRTTEVREVLAELVAGKLILERKGRDARSHYRINRRRAREIAQLLKQWAG